MQWCQRDECLEFLLELCCDQRWGGEAISPMHHPMANEQDLLAMLFKLWRKPLIQDLTNRLIWSPFAVAVPNGDPCESTRAALRLELPRLMTRTESLISAHRS